MGDRVVNLSFSAALEAMKAGWRVARAGWNGNLSGSFVPPSRAPVVYEGLCYILLATGDVAFCDAEDYDLVARQENWTLMGNGYPAYSDYSDGAPRTVTLHQLLMGEQADHANGNKLDNRRRNLRPATTAENNANRASIEGSSSRFKGVTWDKSRDKWMAAIAAHGASRTLGRFDGEEEAARAYDSAARAAYGRFARLNFPEPRMWIALGAGGVTPAEGFWNRHTRRFAEEHGGAAEVLPYFLMKTADDKILMGWLASQSDLVAEDWEVLDNG